MWRTEEPRGRIFLYTPYVEPGEMQVLLLPLFFPPSFLFFMFSCPICSGEEGGAFHFRPPRRHLFPRKNARVVTSVVGSPAFCEVHHFPSRF